MLDIPRSTITMALLLVVIATCVATAWAQTTPVPILKQINRQNEDGSYSYGYEAADGTFKIETKYPSGEVYGKYGYVDETGKVRQVEYGASKKRGFEPAGTDINVPPPTLVQASNSLGDSDYDDGQYREDPSIYYKEVSSPAQTRTRFSSAPAPAPAAPIYQQPKYSPPTQTRSSWSSPAQSRTSWSAPAQPQWAQQQFNSAPVDYNQFRGHPATNFDPLTGSYSINYVG